MNIIHLIKSKILSWRRRSRDVSLKNEDVSLASTATLTNDHVEYTREELKSQLRAIANDQTDYPISHGAMCYSPKWDIPLYANVKCGMCFRKIDKMEMDTYTGLVEDSVTIKSHGIAQVKIVCLDCLIEMCKSGQYRYDINEWIEYINREDDVLTENDVLIDDEDLIVGHDKSLNQKDNIEVLIRKKYQHLGKFCFVVVFFQPSDEKLPHLSVTSPHYLDYLINFLDDHRVFKSWNDSTILLRNNVKLIENLTGLKL